MDFSKGKATFLLVELFLHLASPWKKNFWDFFEKARRPSYWWVLLIGGTLLYCEVWVLALFSLSQTTRVKFSILNCTGTYCNPVLYRVGRVYPKSLLFVLKSSEKVWRDLTLKLHRNNLQTTGVLDINLQRWLSAHFVTRDQQIIIFKRELYRAEQRDCPAKI